MISIGDRYYFINLEKLDKVLNSGSGSSLEKEYEHSVTEENYNEENVLISKVVTTTKSTKPREIDPIRYQVISAMIDEVLHYGNNEDDDNTIPKDELDELPMGMKFTINTLLEYGIISFIENK